tara:strand:+ start:513 stop:800 length:288 start_codon:yes stop_codon:yes gene_type:complete
MLFGFLGKRVFLIILSDAMNIIDVPIKKQISLSTEENIKWYPPISVISAADPVSKASSILVISFTISYFKLLDISLTSFSATSWYLLLEKISSII